MTYFFETYGCQMNAAESAALRLVLAERGWLEAGSGDAADLVLINTCSVRETAEKRVLGRLAQYEALKKKRGFVLVLAGCMAQKFINNEKGRPKAADYFLGTASRSLFPEIAAAVEQGRTADISREEPAFSFSSFHHEEGQNPFRAFVPIMHGCDNFCSYCIVPYLRGREVCRSPSSIQNEIRLLAQKGVREITLLGQNVNSYLWKSGREDGVPPSGLDFPGLLEFAAGECAPSSIGWVRFLSSHPKDLSSRAVKVMANNRVFCRHLHLCVQHGSDSVLKAMNRRYTRESYINLIAEIREAMPEITFSTDILVGFPGESDDDLELTLDLMEKVKFLYSYMYHYNPREGTAAYKLPGRISEETKRKRLGRVIALQKKHTLELLNKRIGACEKVLIEGISRKNADELIARTERDEMVVVPGKAAMIGSFATLRLDSLRGNTFRAKELTLCPGD